MFDINCCTNMTTIRTAPAPDCCRPVNKRSRWSCTAALCRPQAARFLPLSPPHTPLSACRPGLPSVTRSMQGPLERKHGEKHEGREAEAPHVPVKQPIYEAYCRTLIGIWYRHTLSLLLFTLWSRISPLSVTYQPIKLHFYWRAFIYLEKYEIFYVTLNKNKKTKNDWLEKMYNSADMFHDWMVVVAKINVMLDVQ